MLRSIFLSRATTSRLLLSSQQRQFFHFSLNQAQSASMSDAVVRTAWHSTRHGPREQHAAFRRLFSASASAFYSAQAGEAKREADEDEDDEDEHERRQEQARRSTKYDQEHFATLQTDVLPLQQKVVFGSVMLGCVLWLVAMIKSKSETTVSVLPADVPLLLYTMHANVQKLLRANAKARAALGSTMVFDDSTLRMYTNDNQAGYVCAVFGNKGRAVVTLEAKAIDADIWSMVSISIDMLDGRIIEIQIPEHVREVSQQEAAEEYQKKLAEQQLVLAQKET